VKIPVDFAEVHDISSSISTRYSGVQFRSRLEARWAALFDLLGFKWHYEMEAFSLPCGAYLPDFWLPDVPVWAEVKIKFSPKELTKCLQLAHQTHFAVLLLDGPPENRSYLTLPPHPGPPWIAHWHCLTGGGMIRGICSESFGEHLAPGSPPVFLANNVGGPINYALQPPPGSGSQSTQIAVEKVRALRLWDPPPRENGEGPPVMPFGKHKGLTFSETPIDYLLYVRDFPDLNPIFRKQLEEYLRLKGW